MMQSIRRITARSLCNSGVYYAGQCTVGNELPVAVQSFQVSEPSKDIFRRETDNEKISFMYTASRKKAGGN